MIDAFTFRTAHGVWANDMRNSPLLGQDWPCITLDKQSMADIEANIKFQAESGFNSLTVFGLLTASAWFPDVAKTVHENRKRKVKQILKIAKDHGIKILYGLGVYSWGFDEIIKSNPSVQGTNPKVMCASKPESLRWMEKVIDYLLDEYGFEGFHLEAADLGRCECELCKPKNDSEYFCDINTKTASYIRSRDSKSQLMVSMCGYLPKGQTVSRVDWKYYQLMSEHIDYIIDPGHFGTFVPLSERAEFLRTLKCAFGNGGGVWLYPPQQWNRLRYFIPYTRRTGKYIEDLYKAGGRAIEYNVGPTINPAVEINIAFGGRKLNNVDRDNHEILSEIAGELYQTKSTASTKMLVTFFEKTEEAFFCGMDEVYPKEGLPLGEIHLTYLFGTGSGPAVYLTDTSVSKDHEWYLTKTMTPTGRSAYGKKLKECLDDLKKIDSNIGSRDRLQRIRTCLNNVLADLSKS